MVFALDRCLYFLYMFVDSNMGTLVYLVCEHGELTDRDKLNVLSTCKEFRALLNKIRFTERYNYDRIKHLPFLDSFTHIYAHIRDSEPIDTRINDVIYEMCDKNLRIVDHIPKHVKMVEISPYVSVMCVIPETVNELTLKDSYGEIIRIQDGVNIIERMFTESCTVTRTFAKPLIINLEYSLVIYAQLLNVGRILMGIPSLRYSN